ncbi:MAG: hypothetical protein JXB10_10345 [Pirellulales bacterium]|nr:hypothetical protein [Pirellulales bacterium]
MPEVGNRYKCLQINAPQWYRREDFMRYLQQELCRPDPGLGAATWHRGPRASEYSDLFLWFEDGDGSDFGLMPDDIWQELCQICQAADFNGGIVWIKNLQE